MSERISIEGIPEVPLTSHCGLCQEPLLVRSECKGTLQPAEPDDVELPCHATIGGSGHHFHWECLMQENENGDWDGKSCPFPGCVASPLNEAGRLIVRVVNDVDVVEDYDLTAMLDNENGDADDDDLPLERRREIALFHAAYAGDLDDVKTLLKLGVDPNSLYDEDTELTPLHAAAMMEKDLGFDIVEALVKKGASPHLQTADGYSSLDAAKLSKSHRVYDVLIQSEASEANKGL